jgi:ABC-type lipoprotein export system ATPase subunit
MTAPVVVARGVTKMWSATAGLGAVDLDVSAGELVVVRGRSGSGKSTLLAVLAGWCRPDAGVLTVDGQPPGPDEPWERIALVPQALCLAVELSVRENVADAGDDRAVDALLDRLDLTAQARRTLSETSSGQQQRVALARALVAAPRLLLADEPTSFQDGGHVATVVSAVRAAAEAGSAVVVATHDPAVIVEADRVLDLAGNS